MQLVNGTTNTDLIHCRSIILFTYHFFYVDHSGNPSLFKEDGVLENLAKRGCVFDIFYKNGVCGKRNTWFFYGFEYKTSLLVLNY